VPTRRVIQCRRGPRCYGRLGRLRERYVNERDSHTLDSVEHEELRKVFEEDVFIKGMLDGRQISEHIHKRSGGQPVIRRKDNSPIPLSVQVSAESFFGGPVLPMPDDLRRTTQPVTHLDQLEEAERRIKRALDRTMNKQL